MYRTGLGYDIHRTALGRRLVLGGVEIAADFGLVGHSDADVVLHALCDALLGAAALGDIGELFPDSDPQHAEADSRGFVRETLARVRGAGYEVVNVDLMILAERPKLGERKLEMRAVIAELLGLTIRDVGVKAGTNERLGEIGRGEALACLASALLRHRSADPVTARASRQA